MSEDLHPVMREFNKALSSRAWDELRNSQYVEPCLTDENGLRLGRRRLMLWISPSGFSEDKPHTLTVFQPFEETRALLRKAVWDTSVYSQILSEFENGKRAMLPEPRPTIRVSDTTINPEEFEARLAEGFELRIPILWPWPKDRDCLTTDVGLIGFEFFDIAEPQASLRCGWSMDLPPEWEPVTEWFGRMYQWLDSQLLEV